MSAHTPGPWTISTLRTTSGICHQIGPFPWRDGQQNHACIYVDGQFHSDRATEIQRELLANAHVIAAAPDLLSVARTMLPENLCLTNPNVRDETVVPLEVTMGELRKIAAVVAKAKPA